VRRYDGGMSFFSILLALLIEQARPLASGNPVHAAMRRWMRTVIQSFDAGRSSQAWATWSLAVVLPTVLSLVIYWLLYLWFGWLLSLLWSVVVLYVTLGFRHFSHHFTDIRKAFDAGDDALARKLLAQWQQIEVEDLPRQEIIRHVIEHSVLSAHRHVFGVLTWYTLLAALGLGPAGAVFYRLAEFVPRFWKYLSRQKDMPVSKAAQHAAEKGWTYIDWVPARITAMCFAAVGNFEDAIDNWRNYHKRDKVDNDGLVLAAAAGAINVQIGVDPNAIPSATLRAPELAHLRSIVGLVWRFVVFWLLLTALLTLARFLG
jgi:adenosylcobinamide-phosphate synthase